MEQNRKIVESSTVISEFLSIEYFFLSSNICFSLLITNRVTLYRFKRTEKVVGLSRRMTKWSSKHNA